MGTIYLAGPIDRVSVEDATSWRIKAAEILVNEGNHIICDPNKAWVVNPETRVFLPRENAAIAKVDLAAVTTVDALLVYCDKDTYMCGTYIEAGCAYAKNKIIAFYNPTGNFPNFVLGVGFDSAWDECESNFVYRKCFTDLSSACTWISNKVKIIDSMASTQSE